MALLVAGVATAQVTPTRRPTPREAIERNLAPVTTALRELAPNDAERSRLADVIDRAEACGAAMVEAERHGDLPGVRTRARHMELLARLVRARVDAMRAEASAAERERLVVDALARRTQARAALERAAEAHMVVTREGAVSSFALPHMEPRADAGARAAGDVP